MKKVLICDNAKKAELKAILEDDPYGVINFSKLGFTLKDGSEFDLEKKTVVLINYFDDKEEKFILEKLKDVCEEAKEDKAQEIIKKVEEAESAAQSGFGSLFG
ncbi:hypothetical protein KO317_04060 [Candidatus Micrarchaeota archaeon]|jgi:hypothetical protein|nr:hypothetical protein [Candidatus Micrarchaeota archaeon]